MSYVGKGPIDRVLGLSQKNTGVGDGTTTSFDILSSAAPEGGDTAVDVFVDNVRQEPGVGKGYVLAQDGSNEWKRITFSAAPVSLATIWTNNRLRTQITTVLPGSGTITSSLLASNSVTNIKVADDAIGVAELSATGTASATTFLRGDNSWGAAGDFKDGGDAGGANRTLGNTDDFSLGFETNNIDRLNIAADGFAQGQIGFAVGNTLTVGTTCSTPSGESALSVGPITVSSGVTVTVPASSYWVLV